MVKNPPANAGDRGDVDSIPGSGTIPWRRAERPISAFRGAWWAAVHGVAKSGTLLKRLSTQGTWYLGWSGCISGPPTTVSKQQNPRGGGCNWKGRVLFASFQTKRSSSLSSGPENYKRPFIAKKLIQKHTLKDFSKSFSPNILLSTNINFY